MGGIHQVFDMTGKAHYIPVKSEHDIMREEALRLAAETAVDPKMLPSSLLEKIEKEEIESPVVLDPPTSLKEECYCFLKYRSRLLDSVNKTEWKARDGNRFIIHCSDKFKDKINIKNINDCYVLKIKNYNIVSVIKNVTKNIEY